jgi:hypothetical protein
LWVTNQRRGGLLISSRSTACSEAAWWKHRQPNCVVASSHLFSIEPCLLMEKKGVDLYSKARESVLTRNLFLACRQNNSHLLETKFHNGTFGTTVCSMFPCLFPPPLLPPSHLWLVHASASSSTEKHYRHGDSIDHSDKGEHQSWYSSVNFLSSPWRQSAISL